MLEDIFRLLESERDFDSNRQEEKAVPDVIEKSSKITRPVPESYTKCYITKTKGGKL